MIKLFKEVNIVALDQDHKLNNQKSKNLNMEMIQH